MHRLLILPLIILLFCGGSSRDYSGGILTTGNVANQANNISAGAWIYLDNANFASRTYMVISVTGTDMNFAMTIGTFDGSDENIVFETRTGGDDGIRGQSASDVPIQEWHHVAVTYDGSNLRFYLDGVLDDTDAYSTNLPTGTMKLEIATRDSITSNIVLFDGKITWPFYVTRLMSVEEIAEVMFNPTRLYDNVEIVLGSWGDSPELDYSGNKNDATVTAPTAESFLGPPIMLGGGSP